MNDQLEELKAKYDRRLARERRARVVAEDLLEAKSRELYAINQKLQHLAAGLEQRVSERTRDLALAERRALSLAERDQLTGIANRTVFARMSEEAISRAKEGRGGFALFLIDLDDFKHVNDGFGHHVGDRVLCEAADRIVAATRSPDCAARLGGDEFAVLVSGCECVASLAAIATRIIRTMAEPFRCRDRVIEISCSIGIAVFPDHALDAAELQRFADLALYRAKAAGRKTFSMFDDALRCEYDERRALGYDLKFSIERGDVGPCFQPIVDAHSRKLVGAEALARWRHLKRGVISPAAFLAIAEERGLMNDLSALMLRTACRSTLPWVRKGLLRYIAVNISPSQFRSGQLIDSIKNVLTEERFPPEALNIEITEDVLLNDMDRARLQLTQLAAIGVRVALDDFGVGYSNIAYLRRLPIHQLKLDRILTANIEDDSKSRAILGAIVNIARALDLKVIAEGVETTSQAQWLSHLGCDKLQGYLYGKPLPWTEFAKLWAQSSDQAA